MTALFSWLLLPLLMAIELLFPVAPAPAQTGGAEPQMYFEMPPKDDPYYEDFFHPWQKTLLPPVDFERLRAEFDAEAEEEQDFTTWLELLGNQLIENDFKIIFLNYPRAAVVFKKDTGDIKGITDEGVLHTGFSYNVYQSLFYATKNPWMRVMGFNEFYDWLADDGTGMFNLITRRVRFPYNGLDYQIQIWKGNYFFKTCMGAEVGVYTKPQSRSVEHYDCYPLDQMMPMSLKLYNERNLYFDLPPEDHWWAVMMAHRAPRVSPHQVSLDSSIDFTDDPGLGEAFYAALQEQCPDFTIIKDGNTVWFRWLATEAVEPIAP